MATQVKLYIEPEQTIRRFNLDANASYETLKQRVEALVGHANFRILWLDNEKDFVVLGSADELAAAKEVLTNNLLRLFVRPTAIKPTGGEKKVHRGVTCDGCQGQIAGARYKCLECVDYDLCEGCHGKGMHQEHDMLLIRGPRSREWQKLFVQGYGSREGQTTGAAEGEQQHGPCGARRHCGPRGPGHHHHHRGGFGSFPAGPFPGAGFGPFGAGPFGGPFGAAPPGVNVPPFCGGPAAGEGRPRHCRGGPGGHHMPPFIRNLAARAAAAASAATGQTLEMDLDLNRPVAEIIADVTKKVMGAMNQAQAGAAAATETTEPKTEEEKKAEQEAVNAAVNAMAETVTAVSEAVTEFVEELSKAESENEWTHLEAEGVEETKQPEQNEQKPESEQKPQPEEKTTEKDQRIETALRAMEGMGFSTEGTLLRRLLENYNGDIARVLDSIK